MLWEVIMVGDVRDLERVVYGRAAYECLELSSGRRRRAACVMIACADEVIETRLFGIACAVRIA